MIYLDSASTTKVDDRVLKEMLPYFSELFGNASSSHDFGNTAKYAIDLARKKVASLINADINEIIFTSCATESINLALKGFVESNYGVGNHIITVKTEHKAILETCKYLEERGIEVTYLDVNKYGIISINDLKEAIRPKTILISVMYVNNETGVIQPIREIGSLAKEKGITFFCDATQAIGKIVVDVKLDNIDMLCFSAHKINGPKGVGILYKKKDIELTPLLHGGGQENGLRSGTYNTPLIVGLGKACEIAREEMKVNNLILGDLNDYLIKELIKINGVTLLGNNESRVYNIIDILVPGLNSDIFISKTADLSLSNGSACTSQIIEPSHVLKAMGLNKDESNMCIRVSFEKNVKKEEINRLINYLKSEVKITS